MSQPPLPSNTPPHVLVVGAGAIGSYYGGRLQQAGARVSVVCRSDYAAVKQNGFQIHSVEGDFHFTPDHVFNSVTAVTEPMDYVLVTTKVLPELSVADLIRPVLHKETAIVLLQNGMDIEPPVQAQFPNHVLISALAFICVSRTTPGVIVHQDFGRLAFGRYPTGNDPKVDQLAALFQLANVACTVEDDVVSARYRKLVWNAPFNPISVLGGGLTTRDMLTRPASRELVKAVMTEVLELAKAAGKPIDDSLIEKNIEDTEKMVPYKTSMLLDFENNRPLEVDAILGNAVAIAERLKVPVPCMTTLYALLVGVDAQIRSKGRHTGNQPACPSSTGSEKG